MCFSSAQLMQVLGSLPATLNETYDRILCSILHEHRRDALRVLQWLAFSARPISLQEAVEVLATDPDAEDGLLFDPRRRLWDPRNLVAICSSLVIVSAAMKDSSEDTRFLNNADANERELRLAHVSVRDYLISEHLRTSDARLSYYHFNEHIADTFIAKTCLAYLMQFNEHHGVSSITTKTHPLSGYASRYWPYHAQPDRHGACESLHGLIMALLQPPDVMYMNWLRLHDPDASLYYSSLAELERTCQRLLRSGSDVHAQGGQYGNALLAAVCEGEAGIVRLSLDNGADVNSQGGLFGSALQAAATGEFDGIIQLLLDRGADVNMQGGICGSVLRTAAFNGHYETVRLLLEKGVDVNLQGKYGSALQAAAYNGHNRIVSLLLE
ncbi:ankyrin repeat-containing domain protein, partial [Gautieria morchelliformis]